MSDTSFLEQRSTRITFVPLALQLLSAPVASQDLGFSYSIPCPFCINGNPVSLPEKTISIPGVPVDNCGAIDLLAPTLFGIQSQECRLLQSLGTICGCEKQPNSCNLCTSGGSVGYPDRELTFFSGLFQGFTPTCEIFEAYLDSLTPSDTFCALGQAMLTEYCGCESTTQSVEPSPPCYVCGDGSNVTLPDKSIPIENFPFNTCGVLNDAAFALLREGTDECRLVQSLSSHCGCPRDESFQPCSVCIDGTTPVPDLNKTLDILADEFLGFLIPCGLYEEMTSTFAADSPECLLGQAVGIECGCAPAENHCEICPGGIPKEHLNDTFEPFGISCQLYEMTQYTLQAGSFECFSASLVAWYCGCNDGIPSYYGATTRAKQLAIVWLQRITGSLSILGSLAIMYDVIGSRKKRSQVYNQLVVGISFFDFWSSIGWILGPIVTPPYYTEDPLYGYPTGVQGAYGNEVTCTLFGFVLGWGISTSIFYNSALSLYYRKVIVGGWRDRNFTLFVRILFHGIPICIGTALALGGISLYTSTISACTLPVAPVEDNWPKLLVFYWVPLGGSMLFVIANTISVYLEVRSQSRKGRKWGFKRTQKNYSSDDSATSGGTRKGILANVTNTVRRGSIAVVKGLKSDRRKDMEAIVFWQSFWYLLAFIGSIPILLILTLGDLRMAQNYVFNLFVAMFGPIQGLNNAMIYFRPRFVKRLRKDKKRKRIHTSSFSSLVRRLKPKKPDSVSEISEDAGPRPKPSDEGSSNPAESRSQESQYWDDLDPNVTILSEIEIPNPHHAETEDTSPQFTGENLDRIDEDSMQPPEFRQEMWTPSFSSANRSWFRRNSPVDVGDEVRPHVKRDGDSLRHVSFLRNMFDDSFVDPGADIAHASTIRGMKDSEGQNSENSSNLISIQEDLWAFVERQKNSEVSGDSAGLPPPGGELDSFAEVPRPPSLLHGKTELVGKSSKSREERKTFGSILKLGKFFSARGRFDEDSSNLETEGVVTEDHEGLHRRRASD